MILILSARRNADTWSVSLETYSTKAGLVTGRVVHLGTASYHKVASSVLAQITLPPIPVQPWKCKTEGNYPSAKKAFIVCKRNSRTLTNIRLLVLSQRYDNAGIKWDLVECVPLLKSWDRELQLFRRGSRQDRWGRRVAL